MFEKTLRWRMVLIFEEMEVIKDLFGIQFYGTTVKMEGQMGQTATVVGQGGFAFTSDIDRCIFRGILLKPEID